jgi:hypothetical protein
MKNASSSRAGIACIPGGFDSLCRHHPIAPNLLISSSKRLSMLKA